MPHAVSELLLWEMTKNRAEITMDADDTVVDNMFAFIRQYRRQRRQSLNGFGSLVTH